MDQSAGVTTVLPLEHLARKGVRTARPNHVSEFVYCDTSKQHTLALDFYPVDRWQVDPVWLQGGPKRDEIRESAHGVFREHGWPSLAAYRKSECLQALKKALDEVER
ncbi:uncharacterized protein MYCGRDRAFT_91216 [Zymoseptoria tritici IPO323]|uniref:Uncharacterized protein n=1 Tax=Zymoseptoria tritici (strain CBS 115943 / IPO323) TaxID=336722 RepID=F9X4S2_ZYMTI|nr:uncharacterized protein MYCGRDRAFT_91216 [Zymoseptoria tritici IPO323]EGP90166.1 hypothetical protein MYCGRDRAFT_91216 [Zymoseptoria tritici IPO323]